MSFQQGKLTFNEIPRRRLADYHPKLQKVVDLGKDLNLKFNSIGDLTNGAKAIKDKLFGHEFHQAVKTGIAQQVIAGVASVFGGTEGKVAAMGIEIGGLIRGLSGNSPLWGKLNPQEGQWVAIHNGVEHVRQKVSQALGGKFMDASKKQAGSVSFETPMSIGFYVREGYATGNKVVFNFSKAAEEDRHLNELLVLGPASQKRLDANVTLGKLKALIMGTDVLPYKLQGGVPVDNGAEVVFQGETFTVVDCDGFEAKITNKVRTLLVDVGKLSRGRVKHTNSWNYAPAKKSNGFTADSKASHFAGQWVWLPPRASTLLIYAGSRYELGVLRIINAAIGDGYYAVDGIRFQTHLSQVTPCPKADMDWMDTHKQFLQFKIAAVKGVDVERYKLGRDHILEVLGVKTVGSSDPLKTTSGGTPGDKQPEKRVLEKLGKILEAGARNERTYPDRAEDKVHDEIKYATVQKEIQQTLQIPDVDAHTLVKTSGTHEPLESAHKENTSTSSYVFLIVVVLGAAYLVTQT